MTIVIINIFIYFLLQMWFSLNLFGISFSTQARCKIKKKKKKSFLFFSFFFFSLGHHHHHHYYHHHLMRHPFRPAVILIAMCVSVDYDQRCFGDVRGCGKDLPAVLSGYVNNFFIALALVVFVTMLVRNKMGKVFMKYLRYRTGKTMGS